VLGAGFTVLGSLCWVHCAGFGVRGTLFTVLGAAFETMNG
jgi:hypothetical protein